MPRDRRKRVAELLERVGLSHHAHRYPHELSGGQRQRVGIARALALRPTVLLCDEATSGLDPQATASITALLRELRDDLGLAILFITHEMDTIIDVADAVARLDHGRIVESAPLLDALRDPGSPVGAALLPRRPVAPAADLVVWEVYYRGDDVPADWLTSASRELGHDLALLGASVGTVAGATVGHATIGVPQTVTSVTVAAALVRRGLHARTAPATRELDLV